MGRKIDEVVPVDENANGMTCPCGRDPDPGLCGRPDVAPCPDGRTESHCRCVHFDECAYVIITRKREKEQILLVHYPMSDQWGLPGGHVERTEIGATAVTAMREVKEETGLDVNDLMLVSATTVPGVKYCGWRPRAVDLYITDSHSGELRPEPPENGTDEVRWFNVDELPEHLDPVMDVVSQILCHRAGIVGSNGSAAISMEGRPMTELEWLKSSHSGGDGCVELATTGTGYVGIRNSRRISDGITWCTQEDFAAFIRAAKRGEFDDLNSTKE